MRFTIDPIEDGFIHGIQCPRAKSNMTPCVVTDGMCAFADDGACVGCGWTMTIEEWREQRTKARGAQARVAQEPRP